MLKVGAPPMENPGSATDDDSFIKALKRIGFILILGYHLFYHKFNSRIGEMYSAHFLAHLVYQPKSLIQPCFVCHWRHWHHHRHRLCTPPPGTGLDIETSHLVHTCTYVCHICTSNI